MNTHNQLGKAFILAALATVCVTQPALAADIFAAGKAVIKDTAGTGSTIETAMLGTGLFVSVVSGLVTRSWVGAVGGFAGGNILWNVGAPMVGLG